MDLRPYGIDLQLRPSTDVNRISRSILNKGSLNKSSFGDLLGFTFKSGYYIAMKKLGEGTYGATYKVLSPDSNLYAVKVVKLDNEPVRIFVKECLIQILLANESKDEIDGPFVPFVYEVAYDNANRSAFILTQLMDNSFDHIIRNFSKDENDKMVPYSISKISSILDFFYKRLKFNHRDLKGDNVMFVKKSNNKIAFKLIDFGLSCLTWKGLRIEGEGSDFKTCFKKDRDLSQFIFSITWGERSYISNDLYSRLSSILYANVDGEKSCDVMSNCEVHGLKHWIDSYNFFNRPNVALPYSDTSSVKHEMKGFLKGEPFRARVLPGHLNANVKTRKKTRDSPKLCGPGKMRNPFTKRCKKIPESSLRPAKICPEGKILNPRTNRCIKNKTLQL